MCTSLSTAFKCVSIQVAKSFKRSICKNMITFSSFFSCHWKVYKYWRILKLVEGFRMLDSIFIGGNPDKSNWIILKWLPLIKSHFSLLKPVFFSIRRNAEELKSLQFLAAWVYREKIFLNIITFFVNPKIKKRWLNFLFWVSFN